jgi:hypothetical protein
MNKDMLQKTCTVRMVLQLALRLGIRLYRV